MQFVDVNLTYSVPINVSLNDPSQSNATLVALFPAIIAIFGVIIGALIAGWFSYGVEKYKSQELRKSNQVLAYSNLIGCKRTLSQYYATYIISIVNANHYLFHARLKAIQHIDFAPLAVLLDQGKREEVNQIIIKKSGTILEKSQDLKESIKTRERADNLAIQLGVTSEKFWGIIGQVRALYPDVHVADIISVIKKSEDDLEGLDNDIMGDFQKYRANMESVIKSINSNESRDKFVNDQIIHLNELAKYEIQFLLISEKNLELEIDKLADRLERYLQKGDQKEIAPEYNDSMYGKIALSLRDQ
jgi:hypothetical protein